MSISSRIHDTIEQWQAEWSVRLKGWLVAVLSFGLEVFMDIIGKAAAPKLTPLMDAMLATGKVPPELQPLIDEIKNPTGEVGALLAQSASGALVGGAVGKLLDGLLLPLAYALNSITRNVELSESQYLALWLRGKVSPEELDKKLSWLGVFPGGTDYLKELSQVRLDPMSVITAWRRDKTKYEVLFKDLKDQGWDDERIEALKFFTLYYPSPAELIHWTAKEVFEPEMVSKYGLTADVDKLRREDFYKAGMNDEQIDNHWIAHWEHASWMQIIEMLHRGIITEQDAKDWFPLVEIAPYWAENLIKVAYTWPTRVDVRRWWDMRTIDEPRLRKLYEGMGYRGKDLDDYILWTKVYTAFPDLLARFKNGWITEDDIRSQLVELGMPPERVNEMIETKIKPEKPIQVELDRLATATEIMKGVKTDLISWTQGVEMLGDLKYSPEVAEFKLNVYLGLSSGSPETYPEFKQLTLAYRKALGEATIEIPQEIIEASKSYKDAQIALRDAESQNLADAELAPYLKTLSDAEYRYRQLMIKFEAEKKKLP